MSKWFSKLQRTAQPEDALQSEHLLELFAEWFGQAPDPILFIQAEPPFRMIEANAAACRMLGYEHDELLSLNPAHVIQEMAVQADLAQWTERLLADEGRTYVWKLRSKDGRDIPSAIHCRAVGTERDAPFLFVEVRDLSERLRTDRDLAESEQIFDSLFAHNPNGIGIFDHEGRFQKANPMMGLILGYDCSELTGLPLLSLVSEEHLLTTIDIVDRFRDGQPVGFDTAMLHKRGYRVDIHATGIPLHSGQEVNGYIVVCQDITERKRTEEQNRYLAYFDDLTGLPNRRFFRERLQETLELNRRSGLQTSVFYLDIDRFKLVNDSFGNDYGDMLLMQVAERLQHLIRETDLLARTEGDEFAIYFSGLTDYGDLLLLVPKVEKVLEQPFALGEYQIHVTVSIGISLSTGSGDEAGLLMKYADIALSRAKERGKSTYQIYNADMKSVSLKKLTLENELRRALAQQEFLLYYQPQMEIETGQIVGIEALIRWHHPERGMVPPKDFIPFAEESGLIGPIGDWVLYEACRQNKAWQEEGYLHVPISVNLSSRQFLKHDLKTRIADVLTETGLDAQYLELEITESMTMDVDHATSCLLDLKRLGVHVSIDDFGTGYSSLYYLKKFPIDKLKIDQSFVRDIMTDPNDAAIVATIISMTRHLNLKVIAEGVETVEQLQFLHQNRCNEVQGYWFSPPVAAQRMEELLQRHSQAAAAAVPPETEDSPQ
ncbi:putative bifunctional diguanylate cyclase/phosphodiesterase [Paenibacillus chartarius]|uniref:Bifunctional diguanylate cyclase/phosphodiesterase n=1 Tax=Paenibacillus chartarius TaxID=747481 RepID=A0ABV6DFD9_9BACL